MPFCRWDKVSHQNKILELDVLLFICGRKQKNELRNFVLAVHPKVGDVFYCTVSHKRTAWEMVSTPFPLSVLSDFLVERLLITLISVVTILSVQYQTFKYM